MNENDNHPALNELTPDSASTAWQQIALRARTEMESWARSRPRERHRAERAAALASHDTVA